MSTIQKRLRAQRGVMPEIALPLFEWAATQRLLADPSALPRAAHILARRYRLSASIASTVAELAGFRTEANHG
jgi:hypothetical protein